jgi:hypothetical protein
MVEYSKKTCLKGFKIILQTILIIMLCYNAHIAIRDTDRRTFGNRIEQALNFLYKNHPGYRLYMFNEFGIDRKNCTENQVEVTIPALVPTITNVGG